MQRVQRVQGARRKQGISGTHVCMRVSYSYHTMPCHAMCWLPSRRSTTTRPRWAKSFWRSSRGWRRAIRPSSPSLSVSPLICIFPPLYATGSLVEDFLLEVPGSDLFLEDVSGSLWFLIRLLRETRRHVRTFVRLYVHPHWRMDASMNAWMHGCMDAWMHGRMDAYIDVRQRVSAVTPHTCTHANGMTLCMDCPSGVVCYYSILVYTTLCYVMLCYIIWY